MISIKGLTKKYDSVLAVDGLDLEIPKGELFGFLGPNGAGKTTTIKLLVGLLKPTSGSIFINGIDLYRDPLEVKKIIGYIPDRPFLYDKLTGWEYLEFVSGLFSLDEEVARDRSEKFLAFFDLEHFADELIEGYSHGMKQKLIISGALIHNPKVLIVDEPLVGLDPKGARQVKQLFQDLCAEGTTIFLSTHSLGVAETMCHRVGIIQKGKIVAMGTVDQLRAQAKQEQGDLEDVFLKLTGDSDFAPLLDSLRGR
ncbi:MAG: ABC transporter ATP-binding protein [Nitrospinae bacterium]|nr:ABC transporter ATP-binding protein [Nitrospinota bacterium]